DRGERQYFDAADNGVCGLSSIEDPKKRTASMADVVLQFRARTDAFIKGPVGWPKDDERIERQGPAQMAEQRLLLSSLDLGTQDSQHLAEYALTREIIASHPTAGGNAIYEAR